MRWRRPTTWSIQAFLAASLIDERSPDIVQALNDMPSELAVAVLLNLPPDCAIEVQNSSR
jgi:hypothetical protein